MSEIIRDGSLASHIPDIASFRAVSPDVFAERAQRFDALAQGHSLEPYLQFSAALSAAQDAVMGRLSGVRIPNEHTLADCNEHGVPPLSVDGHQRDPVWHDALTRLLEALNFDALPADAAVLVARLRAAKAEKLEIAADNLLAGVYTAVDVGEAPFIGAALQVYWVKMALQLPATATVSPAQIGLCPVCGSHPLASVVRIGGARQGLRYLVCSLCCSEWHMVRVKCPACSSTKDLSYLGIDGGSEAIKAECCGQCKTYLKIFYLERDTTLVAAADDLASLALDLLVDGEGYNRIGPNLLFVPGRDLWHPQ